MFSLISERGPISAADIVRETGLAFATVQRLLHTMHEEGWVRRRLSENTYEIPFSSVRQLIEQRYSQPLVDSAAPIMMEAEQALGLSIFLGVIRANGVVEIRETTLGQVSGVSLKGQSTDLMRDGLYGLQQSMVFAPLGLVQLAFMDDARREKHLDDVRQNGSRDEKEWIGSEEFLQSLRDIRKVGFATRHPNYAPEIFEDETKVWALTVPIVTDAEVYGALGIAAKETEASIEELRAIAPQLRGYADKIARDVSKIVSL